ncbi:AAA family ATPase [Cellulomonas sp. APG4]|uniref:uridine kinase family protein n=1 Tax=Cellulomonas sp. APG4 TaxID=1538656 RepID=UPI00137B6E4E|nr:AAA family ATPase [Cellulomonas sp. APG4]NCT92090.1 AAA family ATPase [Cellulomonas sp. APG4]
MTRSTDHAAESLRALVAGVDRRPVLVGVDGQGGAGKSTFARSVVGSLGSAVVVEGDDFYRDMDDDARAALDPAWGAEHYFDWQRLRREVLEPVRRGERTLRYQRYDWADATMGAWVEQLMPDVVVVEGVYTLRPQLLDLVDVAVWVEASAETRLRRQAERGENADEWIARWVAAEDHYVATHDPRSRAALHVQGA